MTHKSKQTRIALLTGAIFLTIIVIAFPQYMIWRRDHFSVTVPFSLNPANPAVVLPVEVNGYSPFAFELDSAGEWGSVSEETARTAGIRITGQITDSGADFLPVRTRTGEITDLTCHGVHIRDLPCEIVPSSKLGGVDGLIGGPIFRSLVVTVDCHTDHVTFCNPKYYTLPKHSLVLPLHIDAYGHPICDGSIDGMPLRLLIDTGNTGPLFFVPQVAKVKRLAAKYKPVGIFEPSGPEGKTRLLKTYAMHTVMLGDGNESFTWNGTIIGLFGSVTPSTVRQPNFDADIGMQLLCKTSITFDYPHRRLVIQ